MSDEWLRDALGLPPNTGKREVMDAYDFKQTPREERVKTALWVSDMKEVVAVAEALEKIQRSIDGEVTVIRDDGEELAVVWRDVESDTWLVNMLRGSGA